MTARHSIRLTFITDFVTFAIVYSEKHARDIKILISLNHQKNIFFKIYFVEKHYIGMFGLIGGMENGFEYVYYF